MTDAAAQTVPAPETGGLLRVTAADVERMTEGQWIDTPREASRFWVLLVLAAVIAGAGVVADSTATVIGAMIVAPLMVPILGSALALVLADRRQLVRSVGYVLLGAVVVITIGYLLGLVTNPLDAFETNGQVSSRVSPRLIDLVAALATGLVGAFALLRSDVSDTLPGVAIAISLVPPLVVVGLLLEVRRWEDAAGAMLLFATNVAAIVATGTLLLLLARVREVATRAGYPVGELHGSSLAVVAGLVVLVAVPLAFGSYRVAQDGVVLSKARPVAEAWARDAGWDVASLSVQQRAITLVAEGRPPEVDVVRLRRDLNEAGLSDADLSVELVLGGRAFCAAGQDECVRSP